MNKYTIKDETNQSGVIVVKDNSVTLVPTAYLLVKKYNSINSTLPFHEENAFDALKHVARNYTVDEDKNGTRIPHISEENERDYDIFRITNASYGIRYEEINAAQLVADVRNYFKLLCELHDQQMKCNDIAKSNHDKFVHDVVHGEPPRIID
jgi:hypothetical protein